MFTTMNAKKVLFTRIVPLLVLCLFSIIGCGGGTITPVPPPDAVIRVGGKLTPFSFDDVNYFSSGLHWTYGDEVTPERNYGPNVRFPKKGVWIELKNGTRYMCRVPGGCRISLTDFTIIEGEIEVYLKKK